MYIRNPHTKYTETHDHYPNLDDLQQQHGHGHGHGQIDHEQHYTHNIPQARYTQHTQYTYHSQTDHTEYNQTQHQSQEIEEQENDNVRSFVQDIFQERQELEHENGVQNHEPSRNYHENPFKLNTRRRGNGPAIVYQNHQANSNRQPFSHTTTLPLQPHHALSSGARIETTDHHACTENQRYRPFLERMNLLPGVVHQSAHNHTRSLSPKVNQLPTPTSRAASDPPNSFSDTSIASMSLPTPFSANLPSSAEVSTKNGSKKAMVSVPFTADDETELGLSTMRTYIDRLKDQRRSDSGPIHSLLSTPQQHPNTRRIPTINTIVIPDSISRPIITTRVPIPSTAKKVEAGHPFYKALNALRPFLNETFLHTHEATSALQGALTEDMRQILSSACNAAQDSGIQAAPTPQTLSQSHRDNDTQRESTSTSRLYTKSSDSGSKRRDVPVVAEILGGSRDTGASSVTSSGEQSPLRGGALSHKRKWPTIGPTTYQCNDDGSCEIEITIIGPDGSQSIHSLDTDIKELDLDTIPTTFMINNCLYSRSLVDVESYTGNRYLYERTSTEIGWKLAWINPKVLAGNRNAILRSVQAWRNAHPDLMSRRIKRALRPPLRRNVRKQRCVEFYISHRIKGPKTMLIKANLERVDIAEIDSVFRELNTLNPLGKDDDHDAQGVVEQAHLNEVGWKLAWLNPGKLSGRHELLQLAVETYQRLAESEVGDSCSAIETSSS